MIGRAFALPLRRLLRQFPLVSILGARQCGKTTFARSMLKGWRYFDLEKPGDLDYLSRDPQTALYGFKDRLIIDEAHRLPALFPLLRSWADENRGAKGRAALLGSVSPALITQVSESLAGRVGFLDMTPFQWEEVRRRESSARMGLWLKGGFPDPYLMTAADDRLRWTEAYVRTILERDLHALGIEASPPLMRRLWAMLAHHNGGLWNASQLASSLGVNYHTVNRYVDILEGAFLIRKLPPYFVNIGKRMTKSPKIYFRDTGLLHYFLGIHRWEDLDVSPLRGASWESFIIEQVIGAAQRTFPGIQAYFWRTAVGEEVDLILQKGTRLLPIEIKLHSAPSTTDLRGLQACMRDLRLNHGFVVYPGERDYLLGSGIRALPARKLLQDVALLFEEKR